jgi:hypothetical protein
MQPLPRNCLHLATVGAQRGQQKPSEKILRVHGPQPHISLPTDALGTTAAICTIFACCYTSNTHFNDKHSEED